MELKNEWLSYKHFFSEEDNSYVADIPDLTYCSAFGSTPEEALKEVLIAKELWLSAADDNNANKVLQPNYKPLIYSFKE